MGRLGGREKASDWWFVDNTPQSCCSTFAEQRCQLTAHNMHHQGPQLVRTAPLLGHTLFLQQKGSQQRITVAGQQRTTCHRPTRQWHKSHVGKFQQANLR